MSGGNDIAIAVDGVYKQYRLGVQGTQTLQGDVQRWWAQMRGKEDPFAKIGSSNQLDTEGGEYVWALQDISFEVKKGEVLGIIGKNGAGKSTLLKILSKVTAPTKGKIYVNGRIASLLEVGTGFHPELTGRENIFLNGAILGMKKWEIRQKFDEIVEFAGVAKYIDTPVKRYSSGMYVRLAFAVAAFLEPDILIVDEVLAVGDFEFQKKAIGKMKEVSEGGGRTVLFVSHNMSSVSKLCNRGIVLQNGKTQFLGNVEGAIDNLMVEIRQDIVFPKRENEVEVHDIYITDEAGDTKTYFLLEEHAIVVAELTLHKSISGGKLCFEVYNKKGIEIMTTFNNDRVDIFEGDFNKGKYTVKCKIPVRLLNEGRYYVAFRLGIHRVSWLFEIENAVEFTRELVLDNNAIGINKRRSILAPILDWDIVKNA